MDCIHSPRAQALPSNTISYKTGDAYCPSNSSSLSLSLSLSPCNNELDHISDAAETPDSGQNSLLPSYSLLSFYQPHHNILLSCTTPSPLYSFRIPPNKNRLLIFSSSSPLASSRSSFQSFQRRSIPPAPSLALSPS